MGRAERRKLDRKQRIDSKKDKVYLSPKDIRDMKREITSMAVKYDVEVLLTCFAYVMHKELNLEQEQILNALASVDTVFGKVLSEEYSIDEMKKDLEDEVGVVVRTDD